MEIRSIFNNEYSFKVFLLEEVKNKAELEKFKNKENHCLINPEYIIGLNHLTIAFEKAVTSKRRKLDRSISKDFIHYTLDNNKLEHCLEIHDVIKNFGESVSCFAIVINDKDNLADEDIEKLLNCKVLGVEDYSKYIDTDKLKKEFGIQDIECKNETGILGAVYNRLALKDLK